MLKSVGERTMQARINRRIAGEGKKLFKTHRDTRNREELGRYHIIDLIAGKVVEHGIEDLNALAQRVGALKPGEQVGR